MAIRHVLALLVLSAVPLTAGLGLPTTPHPVPAVVEGYSIAPLVALGVTTAITFGPDGHLYATTLQGDVVRVDLAWTTAGPIVSGVAIVETGFSSPLGIEFGPDGEMYVADSTSGDDSGRTDGQVWRIDGDGRKLVVGGLPNGRHNTNNMRMGPDGRLYLTNGNPNDNGVDGGAADVLPISGAILSVNPAVVDASPAIFRWKDESGARIAPELLADHPVNADFRSKVAVYASGFRNVYDFAFDAEGNGWTNMNGADDPDSQDAVFKITTPGTDYGYPFCFNEGTPGGRDAKVVNNPLFPDHDCASVPSAYALIGWHTCGTGMDIGKADDGFGGYVFVAECVALQPDRVVARSQEDISSATHSTSHKVVRVSERGVEDFVTGLVLAIDVHFGPDGAMYVADAEAIYRVQDLLDGVIR